MYTSIFIGIGSNVGNRLTHLEWAVRQLRHSPGLVLDRVSSVYESEAHTLEEKEEQAAYLNAVVALSGTLPPVEVLDVCLKLEANRGRVREDGVLWEPRTLDLDILAFGSMNISSPFLAIPHPRIAGRRFVLEPWNEIAPDFVVPEPFCEEVAKLLADCRDFTALHKTTYQLLD